MKIDKDSTNEYAEKIKKDLIKSKTPDLGLGENDVKITTEKDGSAFIQILPGKQLPPFEDGYGASAKNISKVLDTYYYDFRKKGWTFTQPSNGEFTIAVASELKESYSFKAFLLKEANEGPYQNIKEVYLTVKEGGRQNLYDVTLEAKFYKADTNGIIALESLLDLDYEEKSGSMGAVGEDRSVKEDDLRDAIALMDKHRVDYQCEDDETEEIIKNL